MTTKHTYKRALLVGKFMPLHNGHIFLIDAAVAECEQVTIVLISEPAEPIPGNVRKEWLIELYPKCIVRHIGYALPRDESGYGHWDEWLQAILSVCPDTYDVVFSSESYGERLATDLNAKHVLVDQAREVVPVSGTVIRENPAAHSHFLPAIVKEYYENKN